MGWSESRIALYGLLKLGERLRVAMRIHQGSRVVRVHDGRKRVERQRETEFLERLIESLLRDEQAKGVQIMRCGAIGVQLDGAAKFLVGLAPFPGKSQKISARQMCLRQGVIQFERLARCRVRQQSRLPRGYAGTVTRDHVVGVA